VSHDSGFRQGDHRVPTGGRGRRGVVRGSAFESRMAKRFHDHERRAKGTGGTDDRST